MAKRGRPKGSKNKVSKASKKVGRKKSKKKVVRATTSGTADIGILQKSEMHLASIDKNIRRMERVVNAEKHLARKAKKAGRRAHFSSAFEEAEREGLTAE